MKNLSIKIPKQFYVGAIPRSSSSVNDVPSAVMVPYGTDKTSQTRQSRVDVQMSRYNKGSGGTNSWKATVIDNSPLTGFRISRRLRNAGWKSNDDSIYIEDPRGFEIQVNAVNMVMLTDNNVIHNGEIMQKCVWGRDNGALFLLPVNSEPYNIAETNTERSSTKVSVGKVAIGNKILLQNGHEGQYLGAMYPYGRTRNNYYRSYNTVSTEPDLIEANQLHDRKFHVVRYSNENGGATVYRLYGTLNVSRILDQTTMSKLEAQQLINTEMADSTFSTVSRTFYHSWIFKGLFYSPNIEIGDPYMVDAPQALLPDIRKNFYRNPMSLLACKESDPNTAIVVNDWDAFSMTITSTVGSGVRSFAKFAIALDGPLNYAIKVKNDTLRYDTLINSQGEFQYKFLQQDIKDPDSGMVWTITR